MVLHTNLDYLTQVQTTATVDFFDTAQNARMRANMQWVDLLRSGLKAIETTDSDEAIEQCSAPLVKALWRAGKIKPKLQHGKCMSPFHLHTCHEDAMQAKRKQRQSGEFHLQNSSADAHLFGQYMHHLDDKETQNWQFAKPAAEPHHCMVVADPYLFTPRGMQGLLSMLREIAPTKLQKTYHLSLIGKPHHAENAPNILLPDAIQDILADIQLELEGRQLSVCLEQLYCTNGRFHDRYVITNNAIVFLGYGVAVLAADEAAPHRESTWIAARPYSRLNEHGREDGVFIASLLLKKLRKLKHWLGPNQTANLQNPLFHFT